MDDLISVIVPVYNGEHYLERCINSVLSSRYKTLDIILIDDGSTDRSGEICNCFARADARISVYHLKNGGVSRARNKGISYARGKYIAFIDCDDYVEENYFYDLYKNIIQNKSELAIGSIAHIQGSRVNCVFTDKCVVSFLTDSSKPREYFLKLNQTYLLYGPVNKLYISDYIKKYHVRFPEDISYGEDLLFNLDYMQYCNCISYEKEPFYYYDYTNEFSLSRKYRVNLFENGIRLNIALREFFISKHFWGTLEKQYVYGRIFDDAYNTIMGLWNPQCSFTLRKKLQRTRSILKNPEVRKSCSIADTADYSHWNVKLMKKERAEAIVLIMEIRRIFYKMKNWTKGVANG